MQQASTKNSRRSNIAAYIERLKQIFLDVCSPRGTRFKHVEAKIASIEGLLVPGQEKWLFQTARTLKDQAIIVEIGGYKGRSTTCFAFGCLGTSKRIYTIDTFNGNEVDFDIVNRVGFFDDWQENLRKNELIDYVTPLVGFSSEVAATWSLPIDLLFIDGSHVYEDALADFDNFYPHVVPGGIVAMHDVEPNHPGCQRVWDERAVHNLIEIGHLSTLAFGRKPA